MAGKNGKDTGKATRAPRDERAEFVGYVNITLTEEDRLDYDGYNNDPTIGEEAYLDALDLGYQFTVKFERESDCFSCSISNWSRSATDSGVIYTGRSSTPHQAVAKAVYVWDRKLSRNLNNGHVKGTRRDAF